jgi:hypothetical protein
MFSKMPAVIAIGWDNSGRASGFSKRSSSDRQSLPDLEFAVGDQLVFFGGQLLDSADGPSLALFQDVAAAVRCAARIQTKLNELCGAELTSEPAQLPRIGVCDVQVGEDVGPPSNLDLDAAAKIMSAAEPGGLSLSRTAYDIAKQSVRLPYDDRSDPSHIAFQCGEIRKKYHSMDLALMSAVKVRPAAFRKRTQSMNGLHRLSLGAGGLVKWIVGLGARHGSPRDRRGE